jgi:FixJ family two-component response regulator
MTCFEARTPWQPDLAEPWLGETFGGDDEVARDAALVHIVDLDDDARTLSRWLRGAGLRAQSHGRLGDIFDAEPGDTPSCLVIDAGIARGAHTDLCGLLRRLGDRFPVVMTARAPDTATVVQAMKTGVIDFVEKPFVERGILRAVDAAIAADRARRETRSRQAGLSKRFVSLSRRERQVMALVTSGKLNKQAAGDLGLSEITVKAHRGAVMRKMGARSLAELVRMADQVGELTL